MNQNGGEHLAAVGEEIENSCGHYSYEAQEPFRTQVQPPEDPWTNRRQVQTWLDQIITLSGGCGGHAASTGDRLASVASATAERGRACGAPSAAAGAVNPPASDFAARRDPRRTAGAGSAPAVAAVRALAAVPSTSPALTAVHGLAAGHAAAAGTSAEALAAMRTVLRMPNPAFEADAGSSALEILADASANPEFDGAGPGRFGKGAKTAGGSARGWSKKQIKRRGSWEEWSHGPSTRKLIPRSGSKVCSEI